jgi:diadenosine tetraphosphate (Ap4A) HIT family hydrolase
LCGDSERDAAASGIARLFGAGALSHCFLYEDDDLFVIPGPGNFTVGYLILAPHHHYRSFATVGSEILARAETLITTLCDALAESLGSPLVVFEHGAADARHSGAACVDHAHMHIAPAPRPAELHGFMRRHFEEDLSISGLSHLAAAPPMSPYVLLGDARGWSMYCTPVIQRQLLRRLLAAQHGRPREWNWRVYPNVSNFWQTTLAVRDLGLFDGC